MTQVDIDQLRDIVREAISPDLNELRLILRDGSFVDVWFSLKLPGRYSYHWERRAIDGTIYRHDNAPHQSWSLVGTFPSHFHDGSEMKVVESQISNHPPQALREFLTFVREKINRIK